MAPELWQAALLGIVQGLTEFLPVSSTGHLILVPALFGWRGSVVDSLQFDVALHLGTLIALLAVFWRDWLSLAGAAVGSLRHRSVADPQARLGWLIVLATIPGVAAGLLLESEVETTFRSPLVVGMAMVVVALILAFLDRVGSQTRDELSLGAGGALAVGVGQALALIPGVSRSGSTIATGLGLGLTRASAARFSFLLSTPIIAGALAKEALDVGRGGLSSAELPVFVVGIMAAGLAGYACIRFLLAYLRTHSLMPFVIYRLVVGTMVIFLALNGAI